MRQYRLMIPGPTEVAPEVLAAMGEPLVAHYGAEWTAYYQKTVDLVRRVYCTTGDVFLIPGSGSAGLDAALGSAVGHSGRVLIPQNGFFGERLAEIARSHTPDVEVLPFPLGQCVDVNRVEDRVRRRPFDAVAVVHCETSTGVLNPVRELAEVCLRYDALLVVDAVSSLGVERLPMDDWNIGICVSASQKGLESPPGLAVVAVDDAAWRWIDRAAGAGWYLNLKVWREYTARWSDWHPHPITQAVNNVRALRLGVERILREGLEGRQHRHQEVAASLRRGLRDLGLAPFVEDKVAAHGVTSVVGPEGRVEELLGYLRDCHGILIAGSLGKLRGKVFRVGHMGPTATPTAVGGLLEALKAGLDALET